MVPINFVFVDVAIDYQLQILIHFDRQDENEFAKAAFMGYLCGSFPWAIRDTNIKEYWPMGMLL